MPGGIQPPFARSADRDALVAWKCAVHRLECCSSRTWRGANLFPANHAAHSTYCRSRIPSLFMSSGAARRCGRLEATVPRARATRPGCACSDQTRCAHLPPIPLVRGSHQPWTLHAEVPRLRALGPDRGWYRGRPGWSLHQQRQPPRDTPHALKPPAEEFKAWNHGRSQ